MWERDGAFEGALRHRRPHCCQPLCTDSSLTAWCILWCWRLYCGDRGVKTPVTDGHSQRLLPGYFLSLHYSVLLHILPWSVAASCSFEYWNLNYFAINCAACVWPQHQKWLWANYFRKWNIMKLVLPLLSLKIEMMSDKRLWQKFYSPVHQSDESLNTSCGETED